MERRNFLKNLALFTSASAIPIGALAAEAAQGKNLPTQTSTGTLPPDAVPQILIQDLLPIGKACICQIMSANENIFQGYAGEDIFSGAAITMSQENGYLYHAHYHKDTQDDDVVLGLACSNCKEGNCISIATNMRFFYHDDIPVARRLYLNADHPGRLSTTALPNQIHIGFSLTEGRILVRSNI
jgi:hypothetical protein